MANSPDAHVASGRQRDPMLQLHLLSEISAKVRNGSRSLRALALRARNNILPLTCAPQIFYPLFNEAMGDKWVHSGDEDVHKEVVVVPAEAKNLTAPIRVTSGSDDLFEANVMVLLERIKHYVENEEQPGGRFAEAKKSDMEVQSLGDQSCCVREELKAGDEAA